MASTSSAVSSGSSIFGRPFGWLLLAIGLLAIPLVGYMVQAGMTFEEAHPAINAMINGASAIFLIAGYRAIKGGNRGLHKQCMLAAVTASVVFLASYLARFAMTGTHRYPGDGVDKTVYLVILFSHMLLAAAVVPLIVITLVRALRGRDAAHRNIARWVWPIWIYVSITGVVVYLMLYPLASALHGD